MIDKTALASFIEETLGETGYYLVDLKVTPDNQITVEIDSDDSVDIDFCVELTRQIEERFPRDDEDYDLEVGSAGLTSPFKVRRQYLKNLGNEVEVLDNSGIKHRGTLTEAGEETFTVRCLTKVRKEGAKRPVEEETDMVFPYNEVKYTKYILEF